MFFKVRATSPRWSLVLVQCFTCFLPYQWEVIHPFKPNTREKHGVAICYSGVSSENHSVVFMPLCIQVLDSGLHHVFCFGQRNISKCGANRGSMSTCTQGLVLLEGFILELVPEGWKTKRWGGGALGAIRTFQSQPGCQQSAAVWVSSATQHEATLPFNGAESTLRTARSNNCCLVFTFWDVLLTQQ